MAQNSLQSQFNPDGDERSKRLQGFMMAQMMRNMNDVRMKNEQFLKVIKAIIFNIRNKKNKK